MVLTGLVHVVAAVTAVVLGALALTSRKGGRRHVMTGRGYVGSMVVLNLAALVTYQETGSAGIFHALALASLVTLGAGLWPFRPSQPRGSRALERHALFMAWSYVGLVGAGLAQLAASVTSPEAGWPVPATVCGAIVVGGSLVHSTVPRTLRRAQGRSQTPSRPRGRQA